MTSKFRGREGIQEIRTSAIRVSIKNSDMEREGVQKQATKPDIIYGWSLIHNLNKDEIQDLES